MGNGRTEVASCCSRAWCFTHTLLGSTLATQLICCLLYGSHPFSPTGNAVGVDRLRQGQVNTPVGSGDL